MSATTQMRLASDLEVLSADTAVSGLPVVTVAVSPTDLSERVDLPWREVDSELGSARILVVKLGGGGPRFALTSYDEAPSPVVTIAADGNATEQDIDVLLRGLRIRPSEVLDRVGVRAVDDRPVSTRRPRATQRAKRARPAKRTSRAAKQSRAKASRGRSPSVLELLDNRPGMTVPELAQHFAISRSSLYRLVSRLEEEDRVRKQGHGWHVASQAAARRAS
jgi:hypothetical protein